LPGSHYDVFPVLRAPTMRFFFDQDYKIVMQQLEPMLVPAGTAVILNQSLIHYSPPNTSGKIRKAITAGVKTKDAKMIFYYKDQHRNDNQIEKFEMDEDFLIQFENFFEDIYQRPKAGKSVGFIEYEVPTLTGEKLEKLVRRMKTDAGFVYKEPELKHEGFPEHRSASESTTTNKTPSFFEVYSPKNIMREIKLRLTGK
jgi:hypothetical protein